MFVCLSVWLFLFVLYILPHCTYFHCNWYDGRGLPPSIAPKSYGTLWNKSFSCCLRAICSSSWSFMSFIEPSTWTLCLSGTVSEIFSFQFSKNKLQFLKVFKKWKFAFFVENKLLSSTVVPCQETPRRYNQWLRRNDLVLLSIKIEMTHHHHHHHRHHNAKYHYTVIVIK
jgi:hypothetical protein